MKVGKLMCAYRPAMILAAALRRCRSYPGMLVKVALPLSNLDNISDTTRSLMAAATAELLEADGVQRSSPQSSSQRGFSSTDRRRQCMTPRSRTEDDGEIISEPTVIEVTGSR